MRQQLPLRLSRCLGRNDKKNSAKSQFQSMIRPTGQPLKQFLCT